MNKTFSIILFTLMCHSQIYAQNQSTDAASTNEGFNKSKIQIGGELALSFGTITYVNISPRFGYKVNNRLTLGAGFIYNYLQDKNIEDFEFSTYGGLLFANVVIIPELIAVAEFQSLSTQRQSSLTREKIQVPVDVLFLGLAYRSPISNKSFAYISLLYDIIDDMNSPYTNPYLGVGFQFGL